MCGCPLCTSALRWARHTTTHSSFFFSCHLNRSLFLVQVCCPGGTIFDLAAAVPYVRDHGTHPITKAPLALADLTRLKFETGAGGPGTYACPVLGTAFTPASHIVAVRPTGRVYSWEALESLNVKPRHWQDLVEGAPFAKSDVIVLQDPTGRAAAGVGFVKPAPLAGAAAAAPQPVPPVPPAGGGVGAGGVGGRALAAAAAAAAPGGAPPLPSKDPRLQPPDRLPQGVPRAPFKPGTSTWDTAGPAAPEAGGGAGAKAAAAKASARAAAAAAAGFDPHGGKACPRPYEGPAAIAAGRVAVAAMRSAGLAARALTSTVPVLSEAGALDRATAPVYHKPPPGAKAHARLHTSVGDINLELHAGLTPRTVENFLALAAAGYYDATPFHRSVRHFMAQGGDPTGTGRGGESIYGPTFPDEVDDRLTHAGRGVLGMASAAKDGGGSQFYITYRSAPHLDRRHTVFGRVVGGWAALDALEAAAPADGKGERPDPPIMLDSVTVFADPFAEAAEAANSAARAAAEAAARAEGEQRRAWFSAPGGGGGGEGGGGGALQGVGRYLGAAPPTAPPTAAPGPPPAKKAKATAGKAFDAAFDRW